MLVADIEKGGDGGHWNLYDEEGNTYSNIFDISEFDIKTQMLKSGSVKSPNSVESHEDIYSPQRGAGVLGIAQLYNSVYTVSDATTGHVSAVYTENVTGGEGEYDAGYGFCQYPPLASLSATKDNFISPNIVYIPHNHGVQYLTEFPSNGFYSYFGDNGSDTQPTVYGDSVLAKYYLSDEYSIAAQTLNRVNIRFRKMREYYAVGSTGSSIYMVFRNNVNGRNDSGDYGAVNGISPNVVALAAGAPQSPLVDISLFCAMDNMMTYADSGEGYLFYSADFKREFSGIELDGTVLSSYQPKDGSFILYLVSSGGELSLVYIPKIGGIAARSAWRLAAEESVRDIHAVELSHSVLVCTKKSGLLNVWSKSYSYDANMSYTEFQPFTVPKIGTPSTAQSFEGYSDFIPFYNGSDILGVTCMCRDGGKVAFMSTRYSTGGMSFEIGQYFQQAVSYSMPHTIVSDILFDYSPMDCGNDVRRGNYAFVQFSGLGLAKCHVDDMMNDSGSCLFSATGPINAIDYGQCDKVCTDVRFVTTGHGDTAYDILEQNGFVKKGMSNNFISAKPFLKTTFMEASGGTFRFSESFSCFPTASTRDIIKENTGTVQDGTLRDVEQFPLSGFSFIDDVPIPYSMGVTLKTWGIGNPKHDAALALVKWNDRDGVANLQSSYMSMDDSIGGLHLQYSGICSEVFVNSYSHSRSDIREKWNDSPSTTVYEYPHPCYGDITTAGDVKLPIFDSPLDSSMKLGDVEMVDELLVVKNYRTTPLTGRPLSDFDVHIRESGKTNVDDVPEFMWGGYIVTNFFCGDNLDATVRSLYGVEDVTKHSEIENYTSLFHIKPMASIEFYPEAKRTEPWKPYYAGRYVSFIKKHGDFYYIGLRSSENVADENATGYDIIETSTLFEEKQTVKLDHGFFVMDVKFLGDVVAVQYGRNDGGSLVPDHIKVFLQGDSATKYLPERSRSNMLLGAYRSTNGGGDVPRYSDIEISKDGSAHSTAAFDNVEMIYSLNRFSPNASHKSNLFSIRVDNLGLFDSPYLSETQKLELERWFKNKITDMVNAVKPAQTELFDVYIN